MRPSDVDDHETDACAAEAEVICDDRLRAAIVALSNMLIDAHTRAGSWTPMHMVHMVGGFALAVAQLASGENDVDKVPARAVELLRAAASSMGRA